MIDQEIKIQNLKARYEDVKQVISNSPLKVDDGHYTFSTRYQVESLFRLAENLENKDYYINTLEKIISRYE